MPDKVYVFISECEVTVIGAKEYVVIDLGDREGGFCPLCKKDFEGIYQDICYYCNIDWDANPSKKKIMKKDKLKCLK